MLLNSSKGNYQLIAPFFLGGGRFGGRREGKAPGKGGQGGEEI